jgi:bacterial regulatory proteins, luxR family
MISATEVAKVGVFREMANIRKEISEKLNISVHTVNRYRQNILRENKR